MMSVLVPRLSASAAHPAAIVALMASTLLASPAGAQMPPPSQAAASQPATSPPETRKESVEDRIATLHAALQIAPDQERDWAEVAQTRRALLLRADIGLWAR
jgi:hypothetical protein